MDHRVVYDKLLSPENEQAVLDLLKKDGLFSSTYVHSVVRRDHTPPYVLMTVDGKKDIFAQCMGIFLKVGKLLSKKSSS